MCHRGDTIVASSTRPWRRKKERRRGRSPTILRVPATLRDKGRLSETLSDQVVFSLYGLGDGRQGFRENAGPRHNVNLWGRKGTLVRQDMLPRVKRRGTVLQCVTTYTYIHICYMCAYICGCVCVCVCVLCPVKYEHAGVKPAIDRGKRREKEAVRAAARVSLCSLTFRGKATGVCSFNSGIFLRSASSDCLSRRLCLYLSVLHSFLPPRVYERIRDFFVQLLLPLEILARCSRSQYRWFETILSFSLTL